jgi:hypothetical protein
VNGGQTNALGGQLINCLGQASDHMAELECRMMSEEWLPARLIYTSCSTLPPADAEDKCCELLLSSCFSRSGGNHFGRKLVDQVRETWLPNKVHRNGF